MVTSVSRPLGKRGGRGGNKRERKETSANYSVKQAKLQCRLKLSLAPLKNDGEHCTDWGLRIGPVKKRASFINRGT